MLRGFKISRTENAKLFLHRDNVSRALLDTKASLNSPIILFGNWLFPKPKTLSELIDFKAFATFKAPSQRLLSLRINTSKLGLFIITDANASPASLGI